VLSVLVGAPIVLSWVMLVVSTPVDGVGVGAGTLVLVVSADGMVVSVGAAAGGTPALVVSMPLSGAVGAAVESWLGTDGAAVVS
jgi:hypothetical protein